MRQRDSTFKYISRIKTGKLETNPVAKHLSTLFAFTIHVFEGKKPIHGRSFNNIIPTSCRPRNDNLPQARGNFSSAWRNLAGAIHVSIRLVFEKKKKESWLRSWLINERRIHRFHRCARRVVKARLIECTLQLGDDNGRTPPWLWRTHVRIIIIRDENSGDHSSDRYIDHVDFITRILQLSLKEFSFSFFYSTSILSSSSSS